MKQKSILITGASSGIGRECVSYLISLGFFVYAGVRRKADADLLKKENPENVLPLILDVEKPATIAKAFGLIEKDNKIFWGLINNAGISYGGPLEIMPAEEFRKTLEVNVMGVVNMLKVFLPLIRKNRGRIVNMGSASGFASTPATSAYCASKYGLEALTEALRWELIPFGVSVVMVAPGVIETPIWDKGIKRWNADLQKTNPVLIKSYQKIIDFSMGYVTNRRATPIIKVAKAVGKALTQKKPKMRFIVGNDARFLLIISKLPLAVRYFIIKKFLYR